MCMRDCVRVCISLPTVDFVFVVTVPVPSLPTPHHHTTHPQPKAHTAQNSCICAGNLVHSQARPSAEWLMCVRRDGGGINATVIRVRCARRLLGENELMVGPGGL